jgi:hypothetical protein
MHLAYSRQLEDLAGQTMVSFLILVGPECDGVSVPVIPARLFLDLVDRGRLATQIAPVDASRLGRGIGAWLLEDIIGLKAQISSARSAYRRNRRPGAL